MNDDARANSAGPATPLHREGIKPPQLSKVPRHVAIVMDGNGRWANARGLPRTEGHRAGGNAMMDVVAGAIEIGISELSVYAFSTENWRRSPTEVSFLMGFSRQLIHENLATLHSWNVKVEWAGRPQRLWSSVLKEIFDARLLTRENTGLKANVCINYGGRAEIVDVTRQIAAEVQAGQLRPGDITEKTIAERLYVPNMSDVDLLIRTGGELRTSNFLMWESSYAELYFTDVMWPDFGREELWQACADFASRNRRFGGATDKVRGATDKLTNKQEKR
ncbi:undecaprenyl diphosphate synthase [Actinobaculum suis]|uniref:Isoprenyl transferase n=1 Tax=Actinobaculum suis TaxID=1657 RepID=A0A1B9BBH2_9ACTO|nr:polyprenyl diphosphate synthase [Actinobaculum suis]MDY5153169.1 polyprenyl diphosphate synthase [Actinobaculum suis]OCA93810.1 isoprenyl transferase [Actinobaculum suis]OCA94103.1 isoprenyl transferase [Actinobaculum suis]SDE63839.1 undecaprenyl diphosphate synthase [Actinobaculum suis]VDG76396.1 undecaprenyl diphosphate synthase [Actinobaculum suis]